mmetsp:Transcript_56494/g.183007  ORF Transcript_56494/g.183007 Transcript_56494/m.183007 type:complete len:252 (+) Transcript_56494:2954-3709(+)
MNRSWSPAPTTTIGRHRLSRSPVPTGIGRQPSSGMARRRSVPRAAPTPCSRQSSFRRTSREAATATPSSTGTRKPSLPRAGPVAAVGAMAATPTSSSAPSSAVGAWSPSPAALSGGRRSTTSPEEGWLELWAPASPIPSFPCPLGRQPTTGNRNSAASRGSGRFSARSASVRGAAAVLPPRSASARGVPEAVLTPNEQVLAKRKIPAARLPNGRIVLSVDGWLGHIDGFKRMPDDGTVQLCESVLRAGSPS